MTLHTSLLPPSGSAPSTSFATGVVSPETGVLLAIRKADISRASGSLSLKFGMVA